MQTPIKKKLEISFQASPLYFTESNLKEFLSKLVSSLFSPFISLSNVILHSDQGGVYSSKSFNKLFPNYCITRTMSSARPRQITEQWRQ